MCTTPFKPYQRFVSFVLVLSMLFNVTPFFHNTVSAKETFFNLLNAEGELIQEDARWEELYPNGTFAFAQAQLSLLEGGAAQSLDIYRLGGGRGEAVVTLLLTPPADQTNRYYAASASDYLITNPPQVSASSDDSFAPVQIDVVFAENEFEKSLLFQPIDDDEHESVEFLLATIIGVEGAAFTESANRATLVFNDNEEVIPSIAVFKETLIVADRNQQNAYLTVARSQGEQYLFSVDYTTGDNTAVAGTDFAHSEGTLVFEAGETEKTIVVPLVQDYTYCAAAELNFFVGLTEPRGGSIDESGMIAGVHLFNSYQSSTNGEQTALTNDGSKDALTAPQDENDSPGSSSDEVEEEEKDELLIEENQMPFAPSTPNLITLIARDNGRRVNTTVASEALIANPQHEITVSQGTASNEAQSTSDPEVGNTNSTIGTIGFAPSSIQISKPTFTVTTGVPWTPYVIMADKGGSYPTDSQTLFTGAVGTDFTQYRDSREGKLQIARNDSGSKQWFAVKADGSNDPAGFYLTSKPIENLYEYYSHLDYGVRFYLSSISNTGYFGFGRPENGKDDATIAARNFYGLAYNYDTATSSWVKKQTISATKPLKNILEGLSGNSGAKNNSYLNKYPLLGAYDRDKDNNTDFEVDLETFVLKRAAPKNLEVEYLSSDGFVDTYASLFTPTLQISEGGKDSQNGNPYIGSTVTVRPNANAGCYRIKSVSLQYRTNAYENYTTINTGTRVGSTNNFSLKIASDNGSEAYRLDQLSCKNYDTYYYKIVVTYEAVKEVRITIADALRASDATYINTASELLPEIKKLGNPYTAAIIGGSGVNEYVSFTATDAASIILALSSDYRLVYGTKIYDASQSIPLQQSTDGVVVLQLTHKELLSKAQQVKILGINKIEIYSDQNNSKTPDVGDTLVATIIPGEYDETLFAPQGSTTRLMVIYYTKQPYVYDHDGNENLLPDGTMFKQNVLFENINPSPAYRQGLQTLAPDLLKQRPIDITNDTIEIMGPEAINGVVYIPLGGDISDSEKYDGNGSVWNPNWRGNLTAEGKSLFGDVGTIKTKHEAFGEKEVATTKEQAQNYLGSFLPFDTAVVHIVTHQSYLESIYRSGVSASRKFIPIAFTDTPIVDSVKQEKVPKDMGNDMARTAQPKIALPDLDVELGIFSLSYAGDEILISIGIPLFSSSGEDNASGGADPADNNSGGFFAEKLQDYQKALDKLKDFIRLMKAGRRVEVAPKADIDIDFDVALSINILMTYSSSAGQWQFDSALFLAKVGGSISVSQKLPPPVSFIYVYVVFGADITVSTGLGMKEVVNKDGQIERTVYYKGFILEPSMFAEVGAGVGLDGILSFEVYFKMNVGMKATLAQYVPENKKAESSIDTFMLRGALGFRVELVIFTYEMDVVGFKIEYNKDGHDGNGNKKWKFSKVLFEQSSNFEVFSAPASGDQPETGERQIIASTADPLDQNAIGAKLYLPGRRNQQQLGSLGVIEGQPKVESPFMALALEGVATTDDGNFSFGNYNVESAAYKLGNGFNGSTTLRMVEADGKTYLFYPIDGGGSRNEYNARMLVFSELDTSQIPYALKHPVTGATDNVYLAVYDDATADTEFAVAAEDETIHIVWVNQKSALGDSELSTLDDPDRQLALISENTELRYATFDASSSKLSTIDGNDPPQMVAPLLISNESAAAYEYALSLTVQDDEPVISYLQTAPYGEAALDEFIAERKEQLEAGVDPADSDRLDTIKNEIFFKRLLLSIYGKYSTLHFACLDDSVNPSEFSTAYLDVAKVSDTEYAQDTMVTQSSLMWLESDTNGGTLAYSYVIETPTTDGAKRATFKQLYLGFVTFDATNPEGPLSIYNDRKFLLQSLLDYESDADSSEDGLLSGGTVAESDRFVDPFFAVIGFGKATLNESATSEPYFFYNMNGRHYYLAGDDLETLRGAPSGSVASIVSTLFFEVAEGESGDGKAGLRLATKTDGTLVAIAVQSVAYTENNALFVYEFDTATDLWGKGRPLAMRGLETYEKLRNGEFSQEEAESKYNEDGYQLSFANPQILITGNDDLIVLTETSKIELENVNIQVDGDSFTQQMPKIEKQGETDTYLMAEADKQFYAIKYVSGAKAVGEARLILSDDVLLPGKSFTPYLSFTNTGTVPLRASASEPVKVELLVGNGSGSDPVLAEWNLEDHIPAGSVVRLEANSVTLSGDWAALANKQLYFTVKETLTNNPVLLSFSSYDTPRGSRKIVSGPELIFESTQFQAGTINATDVELDLKLNLLNVGNQPANNVTLHAYAELNGALVAASIFDGNSSISLGALAASNVYNLVYSNNDYQLTSTGGTQELQPDVSNDLRIPLSYFENGVLRLVCMASCSDTTELDSSNNKTSVVVQIHGYIEIDDRIAVSTEQASVIPVRVFGTQIKNTLVVSEMPRDGKSYLLTTMNYTGSTKNESGMLELRAAKAGETVLRLQIEGTSIIKDIVISSTGPDQSDNIVRDTTKPVIEITAPDPLPEATTDQFTELEIYYTVSDDNLASVSDPYGSGRAPLPGTDQYSFTISRNGTYSIVAYDMAGNFAIENIYIYGYNEFSDEGLVSGLALKDVTWNNKSSVADLTYTNEDVTLHFTAESDQSLQSIEILYILDDKGDAEDSNDLTESIASYAFGQGATYRFKPTCALPHNGAYRIVVKDWANKQEKQTFDLSIIDKIAPELTTVLSVATLSYTVTDNLYLEPLHINLDSQLIATAETVQGSLIEIQGSFDLPDTGELKLFAKDKAGNSVSRTFALDKQNNPYPIAKTPMPVVKVYAGQEVSITAENIAFSSGSNDYLFIDYIASPPSDSIATASLDANNVLTIHGVKPGNTTLKVAVGNSVDNRIEATVPITVEQSPADKGGSFYIAPNSSSNQNPQAPERLTLTVGGMKLFLTESNGGRKLSIAVSGMQLDGLIASDENPLVFDLSDFSKAVEIELSRTTLKRLAEAEKGIIITTAQGSISLDHQALQHLTKNLGLQISFFIERLDASNLPENLEEAQMAKLLDLLEQGIPVFDISIFSGNTYLHSLSGQIVVTLPDDGSLDETTIIWYLDSQGNLIACPCSIDVEAGTVSFMPEHLSLYAIGHTVPKAVEPPAVVEPVVQPSLAPIILHVGSDVVTQGKEVLDAPPVAPCIINGRTMLPFRYFIQTLLGGTVDWDEQSRSINASIKGVSFLMTIDKNEMVIDGETIRFDQAPVIVNDYTLVPLRAFEKVVQSIAWDEATQTVTILIEE